MDSSRSASRPSSACRSAAIAQTDAPATYAGDLWSRPRLTGDWWESRDWLAKRGVTLDLDLLQVLQGVATGGRDTGVEYDGLVNYELNLDTGKLGLWPGGFLKVKAFTGYGDTVDQDSGAIVPVNMLGLLPDPDNSTTSALMNLTFTQFSASGSGCAGKITRSAVTTTRSPTTTIPSSSIRP